MAKDTRITTASPETLVAMTIFTERLVKDARITTASSESTGAMTILSGLLMKGSPFSSESPGITDDLLSAYGDILMPLQ